MYIFLSLIGVIAILLFLAWKTQSNIEKERDEGKWDFIMQEYLPYLESHHESVRTTENLSFISSYGKGKAKLEGRIHYNSAGIIIESIKKNGKSSVIEFIRGIDEPAMFKPLIESKVTDITVENEDIILKLSKDITDTRTLIIKNPPSDLFENLKRVLNG